MSLSSIAHEYCGLSRRELRQHFEDGEPVDPSSIEGYRYRGVSLGLPEWAIRLSWRKFAKTFYRDPESDLLRGWNVRIEQDDLSQPWRSQMRRGQERRFGYYQVMGVPGSEHIEIDYGLGSRGISPLRRLRDPLRRLDDRGDLLLGLSQVDIGFERRLSTPSWFLLERDSELTVS
jgi:hypothetical protein